ncbi:MAG: hypothetical protein ABJ327_24495 [Litoreibacter sp.]
MTNINVDSKRDSFIDLGKYNFHFNDGKLEISDAGFAKKIAALIETENGFVVCYNMSDVLARNGMDVHNPEHADIGRVFFEDIFRQANTYIDVMQHNVVKDAEYSDIVWMDADGFNKNSNFTPNSEHTEEREFVTTKCIHFDAATPFIANLYGPNQNIQGGVPIICDTRQFCVDRKIDPAILIENIPNNYNVAIRDEFYNEILDDYSFGVKLDYDNDIVMIALFNEVVGGLAHAATPPRKVERDKPSKRPIRHIEYQFSDSASLKKWYDFYGLNLKKATDHDSEVVSMVLDYHETNSKPYANFVDLVG